MLGFTIFYTKSMIIDEKMPFLKTKLSDFAGDNPNNAKRHLKRCLYKNGALCFASIGLIFMVNISNWDTS